MEEITKIKDLNPSSRRVNVVGKVVSVSEPKEIKTRFGEDKAVTEVVIADDTGKITLTLWNEQADNVKDAVALRIDNGYVSLLRGHMRLNVGKYGSLSQTDDEIEANEDLDMSEKEYENQYNYRNNNYRKNNNYRNRNFRKYDDEE
ncbi:OB-fold nucleic acid binding domain-containing protein [Picrophilus oshimae]|uniref:Replication factor A, large subunit n=1 Tax=Picrophilus torridus (strain ATCC 700027 / DSM 9790 / JCM 10055 / NBRC 100828 / KAW 2/3) TaxID=1122961 RepID=Q6L194_PICTO|nr:OB-fold nucleic acid binding domain-containing protein [Picrophilus oshimae]AAT43258.1 replication factor A, large subunit [Picrophilus oshimae DSM 9789]SMD30435.1 replication factor A1 [Picrophilus oshimae DSM 9789]